jgi:mRNA interferase YafQ
MTTADEPPPRVVVTTKAFERDVKRLRKRREDMERLRAVVETLRLGRPLEPRHRDHPLTGVWQGFRDCHIGPDWLLIYRLDEEAVYLARTGTHSGLFG